MVKYKYYIVVLLLLLVLAAKKMKAMDKKKNVKLIGGNLFYASAINKADAPKLNFNLVKDLLLAANTLGYDLTVTTTKGDHNANTISNNPSRHAKYQAVDIAIINGKSLKNDKEIFTQLGNNVCNFLQSIGYVHNKENGNNKAVLWQTMIGGNHYNHLHISNRT